jgi:hypothetical protein
MKLALALLLVCFAGRSFSQDIKAREEAIRLMERASAASSSPNLPNLERVDTFRLFGDAGVQEGSFSRVVIQGTGRREEYNFGDYHLVNVWTQKQVAVAGTPRILPAELVNVLRITPIWLVRFDEEDVIHTITDRNIGRRPVRCIEFDTVKGVQTDNNELCIDTANGTLLREKLGAELIENSNFFPFAGALMPGKIDYFRNGVQRMEVIQTMTALAGTDANVLAPPPDARMHGICTTYRRPFGLHMPQPNPGSGGGNVDIVVRGMVGADGKVYDATVQSSEREDLNAEAMGLVKQWTFTPSMCDGHADVHEADLTLHFQGR